MTNPTIRRTASLFFFISGFCGLLYQVVWVRLAFAHFGITTHVLSVVLSIFMVGLALGSWAGGLLAGDWPKKDRSIALYYYGTAELLTGLGAFLVPLLYEWGSSSLLPMDNMEAGSYLSSSAAVILISLFPWCFLMGTTFPFMTAFLKTAFSAEEGFSFLYTANVLGAMTGVLLTAVVLIECLGFHGTLLVGASLNALVGLASLWLGRNLPGNSRSPKTKIPRLIPKTGTAQPSLSILILFTAGFVTMALEVVWTRAFTGVLGTFVYSFAGLLFSYLLATFTGSRLYRKHLTQGKSFSTPSILGAVFVFSLLPALLNDARLPQHFLVPLASLMPLCAALGYLTPKLIDELSKGNPRLVGTAYAWNTIGCVLGPLASSYLLLPKFSCREAMILLSLPLALFFAYSLLKKSNRKAWTTARAMVSSVLFISVLFARDKEEGYRHLDPKAVVHRDFAADTVASGSGMNKELHVNGVSVTGLLIQTKIMAHLPMALLAHQPRSVLDICFGMGTTFRSLISWGVPVTGVELVPGVLRSFPFFYSDAISVVSRPGVHVAADDGRRFLQRTQDSFDVITIDPPPPAEAAGSSLLYSTGFYELAKRHLTQDGILQQWIPTAEFKITQAVARSLSLSFPYVRAFAYSHNGGCHFIASLSPIPVISAGEMVQKMPPEAKKDLVEWSPGQKPEDIFNSYLSQEVDPKKMLNKDPGVVVTDDRPYNEYFLLRRLATGLGLSPQP